MSVQAGRAREVVGGNGDGSPGLVLEDVVLDGERPLGVAMTSRLDSQANQGPERIGMRRLVGEQQDAALVLAGETQQSPLPRGAGPRLDGPQIDDDQTEGTRTQQQLGRLAQPARAFGRGHVHHDQRVEIDPAFVEIGGIERSTRGLNPRRGLALALNPTQQRDRGAGASRGPARGCGQLDETARLDQLGHLRGGLVLGRCRGRGGLDQSEGRVSQGPPMILVSGSVSSLKRGEDREVGDGSGPRKSALQRSIAHFR